MVASHQKASKLGRVTGAIENLQNQELMGVNSQCWVST